ncbi:MAG TPA: protein kinase [Thermoanaerobaculia bacterium]
MTECYASAHIPLSLSRGTLVGPYRILAPLGAGGMGEVFRAHDEKLNRDVAVKVLSSELASNADHLRRFQQEAHAASALNHPNIITIYDIGFHEGAAYIAMELVDGSDLRTLQAGERLAIKQILRIAVKVADGLAAAHERGIVHRDLKPENVMMSRDGFVKILDFGLAKLVRPITETETTVPHTTPGAVFGTVSYMSPEQAAGRILDFRSDQFALGVILYEMLTGKLPFSEATAAETLAAIIRREAESASTYNDAIPPELQRIVDRCLAKDPADRYGSTRDLARDLREIRDRTSHPTDPRHRSDRPPVLARRRASLYVASGAALVVLATVFMTSRQTARPISRPSSASIAMLPFRDLSGTSEGQIFADGLAEMIRSRLGETRNVRVIPAFDRTAHDDPTSVAARLGASYALTGAVQRLENVVHLSISLIDAANGEQVAGETLNGTPSDVFELHNRAVDVILAGMKLKRGPGARPSPAGLSSPADQNAYVQALGLLQRARDEKSVDRAIATLEQLLLNARDSAAVNAQLARALLYKSQMSGRPALIAQATMYAERAVAIDDSDPEIHVRLGQLRTAAGRYADAQSEYDRALSLQPDNADAYLGLAETNEKLGRAADAEAMYRKAIALRPNHANTYNRYAVFLFNLGRHREAAANFAKSTELMPSPRGYSNLAAAYQALGQFDDARKAVEKSIALDPTANAYINLGDVQYYSGNYAAARNAYGHATELTPGKYQAWLALGNACRWSDGADQKASEPFAKALKTAREAVAVNPRDPVAHAYSANALAKLSRFDEARDEINAALKLDPTNQDVLYSAAVVSLLRGSPDVAVGWLQRAVAAGYPVTDLQRDPEFKSARTDPSFPAQIAQKN